MSLNCVLFIHWFTRRLLDVALMQSHGTDTEGFPPHPRLWRCRIFSKLVFYAFSRTVFLTNTDPCCKGAIMASFSDNLFSWSNLVGAVAI